MHSETLSIARLRGDVGRCAYIFYHILRAAPNETNLDHMSFFSCVSRAMESRICARKKWLHKNLMKGAAQILSDRTTEPIICALCFACVGTTRFSSCCSVQIAIGGGSIKLISYVVKFAFEKIGNCAPNRQFC